jgi:predicted N-acyltransferase
MVSTGQLRPTPQTTPARLTFGYNPFISHAFFSALEASGSACARTGWGPRHLLARLDGAIAGIVPCYLKSHSQGEYVFDRGWADAYERAGGRYYPKLQVSVPFTPAAGPRLLIREGVDHERIRTASRADSSPCAG